MKYVKQSIAICLLLSLIASAGAQAGTDTTYQGTLRLFVVEPNSRWNDSYGNPFHNAFLDWAAVTPVTIPDTGDWQQTFVWDAVSAGFPDVTSQNLSIYAALFNAEGELRDAAPPLGRYFWAYPLDAVAWAAPAETGTSVHEGNCTHNILLEAGLNTT